MESMEILDRIERNLSLDEATDEEVLAALDCATRAIHRCEIPDELARRNVLRRWAAKTAVVIDKDFARRGRRYSKGAMPSKRVLNGQCWIK